MTKKTSEVFIKSKVDESKIWRGTPTPIKSEVREKFISWLMEEDEEEKYVNQLVLGRDIGLSFEWFFRQRQNPEAPMPSGTKSSMSPEAKEWAGLSRFDPCVAKVRFRHGLLEGGLHTWATMPFWRRGKKNEIIADRQAIVDHLMSMPEL